MADFLQALLAVCSIAAFVTVRRDTIRKKTISDLQALVLAHELTNQQQAHEMTQMRAELQKKDERICALEETIDGYSELVRTGYLLGGSGEAGRNRPATTKATKNRTP